LSFDTQEDLRPVDAWLASFRRSIEARAAHAAGNRPGIAAEIGNWLEAYCHERGLCFVRENISEWYGEAGDVTATGRITHDYVGERDRTCD